MRLPFELTHSVFVICLSLGLVAQAQQQQEPPPEYAEFAAARRITDVQAGIKEFRRLKATYPDSNLNYEFDRNLIELVSKDAVTLDKLLAAQRDVIKSSKMQGRFLLIHSAANMILDHSKIAEFPKADVLKAIQDYKAEAMPLLNVREAYSTRGSGELSEGVINAYKNHFEIPLIKALIMNGKAQEAMDVLERYGKSVAHTPEYYMARGDVYRAIKRDKDAMDAYLEAAAAPPAATAKAKALYVELNGPNADFEAALAQRKAQRPFQPPPFKAPENWNGKTVLAEVFTGSECGPCVAASFAFDALEETYPTKYLAVLKYHLPIPNYDPMINPATKKRDDYYGRKIISGAPTAIIDGVKARGPGGTRFASLDSFNAAKKEIDAVMSAAEAYIRIKATAVLSGDDVKVDCEFSKVIENAEYNVVLVQTEEEFRGGNGILHHNMVVRDLKTVAPSGKACVTFNIPESEKAAEAHLEEWASNVSERVRQGSKWPAKRNKIDRNKLKAVVFVQDKDTKRVYNAFVADVNSQ